MTGERALVQYGDDEERDPAEEIRVVRCRWAAFSVFVSDGMNTGVSPWVALPFSIWSLQPAAEMQANTYHPGWPITSSRGHGWD